MAKLADYMVHHSEVTEMKLVDEKGEISFQKVQYFDDGNIIIGDSIVPKDDASLNVLEYKDYIVSIDDIQFGTKDENIVKEKMMKVYEKLKNIEFSDIRTEKFIIKNERPKDKDGNYILDTSKRELSFEKEMKFPKDNNGKDIKIRGENGEYQKDWTGNYILTKQYTRKKETLNGAFFSLHLNENKHPHFHMWIPRNVKMGNGYEAIRSTVREVLSSEGLIMQEDNIFFDKKELKIEKNSEALNNYRTARQVLSSYSYVLEEYQSLKGDNKLDFQAKTFSKDIINCRKYKISTSNKQHTEITNAHGKTQKLYSLEKLLNEYMGTDAGSQDFINQLIERHNSLTGYNKKDIGKYTSYIENEAEQIYMKKGIKGIIERLHDCIADKEKVPCAIKNIWRELASSNSSLKRAVAEQMTEIYQSRATKQDDIDYKRLEKASTKIAEIYEKYENLDIHEKVLVRFEELLSTETEKESNIINALKNEFQLETLYIDKADKTILRFGTKDYEKVSIKELLRGKTTVYQVISENKNTKQIKAFASEMQVAIAETTNSVGGMVAEETIYEIMKEQPFFSLVPLTASASDTAHDIQLDTNSKKLCSVREQSIDVIKKEFSFEYVNKVSVLDPVRFSDTIINSILFAFENVFGFAVTIAKAFYKNIMQKAEIYEERLAIGNEILGTDEKDINTVKQQIKEKDELNEDIYESDSIEEI